MTWKQLVRKWSEVTVQLGGRWNDWVDRGVDILAGTRDRDSLSPPPGARFAVSRARFPYRTHPRLKSGGGDHDVS